MLISFDLDDTLISHDPEIPREPLRAPLWRRFKTQEPLRLGTVDLARQLQNDGHDLMIYTTSLRKPSQVKRWLGFYGFRVSQVINADLHAREVGQMARQFSKLPSYFGVALHVDDEDFCEMGERFDFKWLRIAPRDLDWADKILKAVRDIEAGVNVMKPLFCAVLLLSATIPTWSAPEKPAVSKAIAAPKAAVASESLFDARLPAGCRATLHFERTKVAAGAIASDCHQSNWYLEVRDAKGQPKSGVTVDLPLITKGGKGPSHTDKAPDNAIRARLEWLPATKRATNLTNPLANQAVTGADGRARGRFTSGFRLEKVEFVIVGGAKASILQAWNEVEEPFDDYIMSEDEPVEIRYTMRFFDGQKWVPITGHHLELQTTSVRMNVSEPRAAIGGAEDDQGEETSDVVTFSEDRPEEAGWKMWLEWWKADPIFDEVEPGVYIGHYRYHVPEGAAIGGRRVDDIENISIFVYDDNGWVGD